MAIQAKISSSITLSAKPQTFHIATNPYLSSTVKQMKQIFLLSNFLWTSQKNNTTGIIYKRNNPLPGPNLVDF